MPVFMLCVCPGFPELDVACLVPVARRSLTVYNVLRYQDMPNVLRSVSQGQTHARTSERTDPLTEQSQHRGIRTERC